MFVLRFVHVAGLAAMLLLPTGCRKPAEQKPSANRKTASATEAASKTPPAVMDGREGRPLSLDQFRPRSMLRAGRTDLKRAKFPAVNVHVHRIVEQRFV